MNKITLVILLFFGTNVSNATIKTAIKTGKWETNSTWSTNSIPSCSDTVVIPVGKTVTITTIFDLSNCAGASRINVSGNLAFQSGKKLKLPCGSRIFIYTGGFITQGGGGGSSNLIDICNVTQWLTTGGTIQGPDCLPHDPLCTAFVLPVELLSFSVVNSGKKVLINWATASEKENDYFTIEKSAGNNEFSTLAKLPGKGTTSQLSEYSFYDENPGTGTMFYRIKQTDFNGNFSYSSIVAVKRKAEISMQVYPNPSSGEFYINSGGVFEGNSVDITIEDQTGRIILHLKDASMENDILKISTGLKNQRGIYIIRLKSLNFTYSDRIVLN